MEFSTYGRPRRGHIKAQIFKDFLEIFTLNMILRLILLPVTSLSKNDDLFLTLFGTITKPVPKIRPKPNGGRFKPNFTNWQMGPPLGSGSCGKVYEGITRDGGFFAVKTVSLLDQGDRGRKCIQELKDEISFLREFQHENIVQYYGTDQDDSNLYIFLELATKGSLLSLYRKYHLNENQVSAYARQILHGLEYLHERKVIHRDIKCANILVDTDGSVKLADFGLAKIIKLIDAESFKGTAFWMAPEVVKCKPYGCAADIWSFGCTVLEMLTGDIPYPGMEYQQALFRIGNDQPPVVPRSLSSDARDFIHRCLKVDPNARPTATQLLDHRFVNKLLTP